MRLLPAIALIVWFGLETNPLLAQKIDTLDHTQNAGKVIWLDRQYDFGSIPSDATVTHDFRIKNVSTETLILLEAKSTCPCIHAEWPSQGIAPNEIGVIKVTFDPAGRDGIIYKILRVRTNFDSNESIVLAVSGKVVSEK